MLGCVTFKALICVVALEIEANIRNFRILIQSVLNARNPKLNTVVDKVFVYLHIPNIVNV